MYVCLFNEWMPLVPFAIRTCNFHHRTSFKHCIYVLHKFFYGMCNGNLSYIIEKMKCVATQSWWILHHDSYPHSFSQKSSPLPGALPSSSTSWQSTPDIQWPHVNSNFEKNIFFWSYWKMSNQNACLKNSLKTHWSHTFKSRGKCFEEEQLLEYDVRIYSSNED